MLPQPAAVQPPQTVLAHIYTQSGSEEGVYIISVASRLLQMHPQTLRKYERIGLVRPPRTMGQLRLYSAEDIAKLRLIKYLVDDVGLNLAGVEMILSTMDRLAQMHRLLLQEAEESVEQLRQHMERLLSSLNPDFFGSTR